jgi:hypothetical protein
LPVRPQYRRRFFEAAAGKDVVDRYGFRDHACPWRILKAGFFWWNSILLLQKCERDEMDRRKVITS